MMNIYFPSEEIEENDLFFICYMIERVARRLHQKNKYIVNEFIYCKPGIFDRLDGFDELKDDGIISEYCLFKWRGAEFDTIDNSGDRVAGFTIQADTIDELNKKHEKAISNMKVLDINGNDIMRRDLLEKLS